MAKIGDDYARYLEDLFALVQGSPKLNDWEKKFMADQEQRYEEHGPDMFISDKQRAIIMKIDEKING